MAVFVSQLAERFLTSVGRVLVLDVCVSVSVDGSVGMTMLVFVLDMFVSVRVP